LQPLKDAYGDDLAIVFKQFPLKPLTAFAAEAALAAGEQGQFWGYHDILFDNQKALQRPQLERYAEVIGLDMEMFKAALDGRTFKAKVDADMVEGRKAGVGGTPAIFVNGRKANVSWRDSNAFKASIDRDILGR
jgi:protein-disulfide isomerase